jgi:hypothetical protein
MELEDLGDLIFDPNAGEFCVVPSTSFEEMQDEIESDKVEVVSDIPISKSVVPEDDFNKFVMDIMNDFDDNHDKINGDVFITDDNDG